jgi:hypothetical protein
LIRTKSSTLPVATIMPRAIAVEAIAKSAPFLTFVERGVVHDEVIERWCCPHAAEQASGSGVKIGDPRLPIAEHAIEPTKAPWRLAHLTIAFHFTTTTHCTIVV